MMSSQEKADLFRQECPYGYQIDEETKKAYPFNRHYQKLGNWNEMKNNTERVYLYNDGMKPWESSKNLSLYEEKDKEIREKYEKDGR